MTLFLYSRSYTRTILARNDRWNIYQDHTDDEAPTPADIVAVVEELQG